MSESERTVDEKYIADGWLPLARGWPDRAYVRLGADGKLQVRLVEIKSGTDTLDFWQELMYQVLLSQGLDVRIDPPSKAPKKFILPPDTLLKMLEALKQNSKKTEMEKVL
jgi:hypothetical protein